MKNKISTWCQRVLWSIGIATHNEKTGECTPDFNCCSPGGRWTFWRVPAGMTFAKTFKDWLFAPMSLTGIVAALFAAAFTLLCLILIAALKEIL